MKKIKRLFQSRKDPGLQAGPSMDTRNPFDAHYAANPWPGESSQQEPVVEHSDASQQEQIDDMSVQEAVAGPTASQQLSCMQARASPTGMHQPGSPQASDNGSYEWIEGGLRSRSSSACLISYADAMPDKASSSGSESLGIEPATEDDMDENELLGAAEHQGIHDEGFAQQANCSNDGQLHTGYNTPDSTAANLILQDQLTQLTSALLGSPDELESLHSEGHAMTSEEANLHQTEPIKNSSENATRDMASTEDVFQEVTSGTALNAVDGEQTEQHALQQISQSLLSTKEEHQTSTTSVHGGSSWYGWFSGNAFGSTSKALVANPASEPSNAVVAPMPEGINGLPEDAPPPLETEETIPPPPSIRTCEILPTASREGSEFGYDKLRSENGSMSDIVNLSAGSNTDALPPASPQLRRGFSALPRAYSSPTLGEDVHTPRQLKRRAVARARQCLSVAQSTCDSPLAARNITSSMTGPVDVDDYLALKEDRDNLVSKLLTTNALLAKEQLLRRAAESDVASQRKLVDQLVSAQEGLQAPPDLNAVPLGTLCSAVGRRVYSVAKERLQHAGNVSLVFAANAKTVVQSFVDQHRNISARGGTAATNQANAGRDVGSGNNTINWQSSLCTTAVQSVAWCLQAVTSCLMLTKAAACRAGRVVHNKTRLGRRVARRLFVKIFSEETALVVVVLVFAAVGACLPYLTFLITSTRTTTSGHVTTSIQQPGNQLQPTQNDHQELARCLTHHTNDMAACLPHVNTEAANQFCKLYMGKVDLAIGAKSMEHRSSNIKVEQEKPVPENSDASSTNQNVQGVSETVAQQLTAAEEVLASIATPTTDQLTTTAAAAAPAPTSSAGADAPDQAAKEAQLALAPPENGICYERLAATLTEQQRALRMLECIPKPPSPSSVAEVPRHCSVGPDTDNQASPTKLELLAGKVAGVAGSNTQDVLSATLDQAMPLLETVSASLLPALQASHTRLAALLASQTQLAGLVNRYKNSTEQLLKAWKNGSATSQELNGSTSESGRPSNTRTKFGMRMPAWPFERRPCKTQSGGRSHDKKDTHSAWKRAWERQLKSHTAGKAAQLLVSAERLLSAPSALLELFANRTAHVGRMQKHSCNKTVSNSNSTSDLMSALLCKAKRNAKRQVAKAIATAEDMLEVARTHANNHQEKHILDVNSTDNAQTNESPELLKGNMPTTEPAGSVTDNMKANDSASYAAPDIAWTEPQLVREVKRLRSAVETDLSNIQLQVSAAFKCRKLPRGRGQDAYKLLKAETGGCTPSIEMLMKLKAKNSNLVVWCKHNASRISLDSPSHWHKLDLEGYVRGRDWKPEQPAAINFGRAEGRSICHQISHVVKGLKDVEEHIVKANKAWDKAATARNKVSNADDVPVGPQEGTSWKSRLRSSCSRPAAAPKLSHTWRKRACKPAVVLEKRTKKAIQKEEAVMAAVQRVMEDVTGLQAVASHIRDRLMYRLSENLAGLPEPVPSYSSITGSQATAEHVHSVTVHLKSLKQHAHVLHETLSALQGQMKQRLSMLAQPTNQ